MRQQPVNQKIRIRILQAGALLLSASLFVVHPAITGAAHETIEMTGVALVIVCVLGRMWSILHIGARKNRELTTTGPYSMTRNPLYFFSTVGALGVGLMVGSFALAIMLAMFTYGILNVTAAKEAEHLRTLFGPAYDDYAAATPMFWPNPFRYRETAEVTFSPAALKRTFLDGLVFVMVFPLIELIEYLQEIGYLPVLFHMI